jgi:hypothetical protein
MNAFKAIQAIEKICRSVLVADRLRLTFTILGATMQAKKAVPNRTTQFRGAVPARRFNASLSGNDQTFDITGVTGVTVSGSPVDASGNASTAVLSLDNYVSSDTTVFTVVPDPANPIGALIQFVGDGTATLTETATATESDGTTEQVQGVGTITLTSSAPTPVAAAIDFTFGTPA